FTLLSDLEPSLKALKDKLLTKNVEGIVVGRTFTSLGNYQTDGNKEMIAKKPS
ncbi:hypothetical protein MKX03_025522, partial [Papaver bracteatum]